MQRILAMGTLLLVLAVWGLALGPARAQDGTPLARLLPEDSALQDRGRGIEITLGMTQAVPYRVSLHADPVRLHLEFRDLSLVGVDQTDRSDRVLAAFASPAAPGWSRLALTLDRPYELQSAEMALDEASGEAVLTVSLRPTSRAEFARMVQPEPPTLALPAAPATRQDGTRPLVVVLDPGHGGFDPGARNGGYSEAVLMLTFARELQEKLVRAGGFEVILTRNADAFVPLPERVAIARRARADAFISLHADALAEGRATGASVYTLSAVASDEASARLAESLERSDLLAGVDLGSADDAVATVLMDLARRETQPRSETLADHLVLQMEGALGEMYKRPRMRADFSVLRAPDIPSVLVELGFLTSDADLAKLLNPYWRDQAGEGILNALRRWAIEDAAAGTLIRQ